MTSHYRQAATAWTFITAHEIAPDAGVTEF